MVTLTYFGGKSVKRVFGVQIKIEKFRTQLSVMSRRQTHAHWKFSLFGFSAVLVSVWKCNFRKP